MRCRKQFTELTPAELDRLADALNELYDDGLITQFANLHSDSWDHIHWEPQFLPWHRYFILRFENALRAVDDRVMLPYWDWTRTDSRDLDSGQWSSFFGGRSNTGGRFDHWDFTRRATASGTLPTLDDVVDVLDETTFTAFRQAVEPGVVHVRGHIWVGEDMEGEHSPRDPLFYLHHCNVDRIWAIWQANNNEGVVQYDTTAIPSDENSPGAPVDLHMPMVGGSTPNSMLLHRALDIRYPVDELLAAVLPGTNTGDPTTVELVTTTVWFNDIPEGEETRRPATFRVDGCDSLNFEVITGPTNPFQLHDGGFTSHPQTDLHTDEVRIWVRYQGTTEGDTDSGTMSVRVTDQDGAEVLVLNDIPLEANTVRREKAAVIMVLDESGSMLYDAGNNRTRLEVLQRAARTFIDNLYDDTGIALVSFDETAAKLSELADAGGMTSAVRNAARTAIVNHGPPNDGPHTSIGAGIEKATELYADALNAADYDIKTTVVFTDGFQDREPWISDVSATVAERIYAIGVANAANVANDTLVQLANGTGGSMLVTGAIDQDDEFLLEKFFIQILAGVTNGQIVEDPPGTMRVGEIDDIDFAITRADIGFDAVILTQAPGVVLSALQAPDGTIILPTDLPPGSVRMGSTSINYRVSMPIVHNAVEHWGGTWKILMTLGGMSREATTHQVAGSHWLPTAELDYHALVYARSNLRLITNLDQNGISPGSEISLTARVNEYGWPIETHPVVRAEVLRPDLTTTIIHFIETETGRFETFMIGTQSGVYRFRVLANGRTTAGEDFTREQLLTVVLGRVDAVPPREPVGPAIRDGIRDAVCKLLDCLIESMSPELRKLIEARGLSLEELAECLCRDPNEPQDVRVASLLGQPQLAALLRELSTLLSK